MTSLIRTLKLLAAVGLALSLMACDPVLNIFGSFFPAWVICLIAGVGLALPVRQLLARARLEPHLGPLLLVYPALALFLTMLTWLVFFRT